MHCGATRPLPLSTTPKQFEAHQARFYELHQHCTPATEVKIDPRVADTNDAYVQAHPFRLHHYTPGELVYLASPYSHEKLSVRCRRFYQVCQAAAVLMRAGVFIFSPIAHTHPIARHGLPTGWDFWKPFDEAFLTACRCMIVLQLDGWKESVGVADEIAFMQGANKPVEYMAWEEILSWR
jgi:hypothetical protein